jgi:hypothetical protein
MKSIYLTLAALMVAGAGFAQTDTTKNNADTIKVGGIIIIKKTKNEGSDSAVKIGKVLKKPSNLSTNWWILDLGFANVNDDTKYGSAEAAQYLRTIRPGEAAFTKDDMKLRAGKSSNVNIWIVMQKLKMAKGHINLKYGLGLEMFNFRYENNISYHKNPSYVFRDSVNFSKNKLYAGYASVPLMLNFNTSPGRKKGLSVSAGVSAGYLIASRNKQISSERGKVKVKDDFDLEKFRLAYIGELGIGPIRLYGSYSMRPLHQKGLDQTPYAVGIRFSNW